MKAILMNKDVEVLMADYDPATGAYTKVNEIYNIEYAPYILNNFNNKFDSSDDFRAKLTEWFKNRGIPSWRDKLDLLLRRLGVSTAYELLDKSFGLSLSDQYWLKQVGSDITHNDINFFDNDFDYVGFMNASFSTKGNAILNISSLKTTNNTTDGILKKAWIIENENRYFIKGWL